MLKHCKVCGAEYDLCVPCEKNHSWRVHTDTEAHYYIFMALMEYRVNHDAERAYSVLQKRGIDLRNTAEYTPSVQALLTEIYTVAHETRRAKKAVAKTNETKDEEPVNNEDGTQQEE